MAVNRYYSNVAISTTLSGGINNSVTSISVGSVSGFPVSFPYTICIDQGTPSEELCTVTNAVGTTLTVTRGVDSTTAASHSAGASVKHVVSARDFREPQEHIDSTAAHGATGAVVGTTNTQTLSNKTISLGSNTVSGTISQFNTAVSDADLATLAGSETLTNKTINLGSNTLSGTLAQVNTMVSDADLVSLAGSETLINKTLTAPAMTAPTASGSMAGFGGAFTDYTPTWGVVVGTAPTLGNGTISGRYFQIGKLVYCWIRLSMSTTTNKGSGDYTFSLPVSPRNNFDEAIAAWCSVSGPDLVFNPTEASFSNGGSTVQFGQRQTTLSYDWFGSGDFATVNNTVMVAGLIYEAA